MSNSLQILCPECDVNIAELAVLYYEDDEFRCFNCGVKIVITGVTDESGIDGPLYLRDMRTIEMVE